jgi:hypothetical protein
MDHADREETILWLVQKGGISPGVWIVVHGAWIVVHGVWIVVHGV